MKLLWMLALVITILPFQPSKAETPTNAAMVPQTLPEGAGHVGSGVSAVAPSYPQGSPSAPGKSGYGPGPCTETRPSGYSGSGPNPSPYYY